MIWDTSAIEIEDLPTLSGMLGAADAQILAEEVLRSYAPKAPSKKARTKAREHFVEIIEEMREIEPRADDSDGEMILLPRLSCEYRGGRTGGKFELTLEADLVSVGEMCRAGAELSGRSSGEGAGARERLDAYSYVLEPWDKVLGFRVWLGGFSEAGDPDEALVGSCGRDDAPGDKALLSRLTRSSCHLPFGRRERYQFLASAVWEMTFFGWSAKKQRRRIKKMAARLEEGRSEPGRAYPIEVFMSKGGTLEDSDVGLEHSTDDYESEHEGVMMSYENVINGWLRFEFLTRVNELHNLLARGYSTFVGGEGK